MKELILLRHAKSSWADENAPDFDRKLSPRGRKAATAIGAWLAENGFQPEVVLSSSARRTRETVAGLGAIAEAAEVVYEEALYLAEPEAIQRRLAKLKPAVVPPQRPAGFARVGGRRARLYECGAMAPSPPQPAR